MEGLERSDYGQSLSTSDYQISHREIGSELFLNICVKFTNHYDFFTINLKLIEIENLKFLRIILRCSIDFLNKQP